MNVDLIPRLVGNHRDAIYLGDFNRAGRDIEINTLRVLAIEANGLALPERWERIAFTDEQVDDFDLPPKLNEDGRDGLVGDSWKCEALGQQKLDTLVLKALSFSVARQCPGTDAGRQRELMRLKRKAPPRFGPSSAVAR